MKIKGLQHVAIAVRRSEKFEKLMGETLGLTLTKRYGRNQKNILKTVYGFDDGSHIELIEPVSSENNLCSAWIEEHGESVYHIALEVENIDEALEELKSRGVKMLDETARPAAGGNRVAFLDPRSTENILIELLERPKAG